MVLKRLVRETQPEKQIVLQNKTVTENGVVVADRGYDGLAQVTVNVESQINKRFSLLDRVYDDDNNAIGTVAGFHTDAENNEYAVVVLDAQFRLDNTKLLTDNIAVPGLPHYALPAALSAKETATFNSDKYMAVTGVTSDAVRHCRSLVFTIGGTQYAGQLPTIMELIKILAKREEINAADTSLATNEELILPLTQIWTSTAGVSNKWNVDNSGYITNGNANKERFVAPILEIPNTVVE